MSKQQKNTTRQKSRGQANGFFTSRPSVGIKSVIACQKPGAITMKSKHQYRLARQFLRTVNRLILIALFTFSLRSDSFNLNEKPLLGKIATKTATCEAAGSLKGTGNKG